MATSISAVLSILTRWKYAMSELVLGSALWQTAAEMLLHEQLPLMHACVLLSYTPTKPEKCRLANLHIQMHLLHSPKSTLHKPMLRQQSGIPSQHCCAIIHNPYKCLLANRHWHTFAGHSMALLYCGNIHTPNALQLFDWFKAQPRRGKHVFTDTPLKPARSVNSLPGATSATGLCTILQVTYMPLKQNC